MSAISPRQLVALQSLYSQYARRLLDVAGDGREERIRWASEQSAAMSPASASCGGKRRTGSSTRYRSRSAVSLAGCAIAIALGPQEQKDAADPGETCRRWLASRISIASTTRCTGSDGTRRGLKHGCDRRRRRWADAGAIRRFARLATPTECGGR